MKSWFGNLMLLAIVGQIFGNTSCSLWAQSKDFGPSRSNGIVTDKRLLEVSGIVASRRQAGILWAHNDSGHKPQLFALNDRGELKGVYQVSGAKIRDWEDIALGPGPDPNQDYLYIGDIGDNRARYPFVTVYRVPEPNLASKTTPAKHITGPCTAFRLTYPDGARDAETLLVDPLSRDLYIISKRDLFSRVYRAPAPLLESGTIPLSLVTLLPWGLATGGDIAPDGQHLVIRSMSHAMIWPRPDQGSIWQNLRLPGRHIQLLNEPQGEAICFDSEGKTLYTISEGQNPHVHVYHPRRSPESLPP